MYALLDLFCYLAESQTTSGVYIYNTQQPEALVPSEPGRVVEQFRGLFGLNKVLYEVSTLWFKTCSILAYIAAREEKKKPPNTCTLVVPSITSREGMKGEGVNV